MDRVVRRPVRRLVLLLVAAGLGAPTAPLRAQTSYDDLVSLFREWREFESPPVVDGIHDYSAESMARQQRELRAWKERLWSFDIEDWPVEQQIDWHLVRAEMNGLDFDHKIRRPWARDPAFYVMMYPAQSDVPAHEGPVIHGWIDTWTYEHPLSGADAEELAERFGTIPAVLEQARENLAGSNARDLWEAGIRSFRGQAADLRDYGERVAGTTGDLDRALERAARASDEFADWLEAELPGKTGPSGVGQDAYTWYMHNVHLSPYSWEEQVTLMRRELARSHATLRLEENRNRDLPELSRISSPEEYDRELEESVRRYMAFLEREEIEEVEPWMDAALRAVSGTFTPAEPGEIRNFFQEVIYRDPDAFRPHMHHWIELARMREDPHPSPIRSVPPLYNIYDHRSEGLATGVEEMFMHLGLLEDNSPRARELVWIMLAQRAARATSGLMLHGNEFDMEEAVAFAGKWTPRGWLPDGDLVRGEQHLYLRQPGYGTS
ncbi:MAG: DUF885 family protein, partial [Gemmatimonadetes bacterium]|nr:DUF885 domain-containing protein [Gemmatimonadota bacterium]NIR79044.1 DUF885 domain-containing protein [Gemmatimonadota bacterium]NIT87701.1 DUF885 domain-containing protein [Gemmatimonadota bacterium]NIU31562.1 DUF885 domain-containing protein [Gemmatimonadota bacterium]NIU36218.1 DUF885 family protein [Gemmatimonadota bacterium]